ncbi:hypothetical protein A5804_002775 [Enterococcus faecium]|uniref:Uncharacterized protein n=1 Tax=Enterococcus faecium TaxID=1352 RepID=A0AB73PIA1_ENTFC|nr:hypothetical protein [Enterococcus faecium]OTN94464.1 hypothetical protein A5804_002775 [Enterococcus faecium]
MLIIGVFLLFMDLNLLLKIYQNIKKIKNGGHFLVFFSLPIVFTTFIFFVDRLIASVFNGNILSIQVVVDLFYKTLNIAHYSEQDPLILVIVSLFISLIAYVALFYQSIKINNKQYFYFNKINLYVPLSEFLWTFTWNLITIFLTYFFLYHYFYSDQFTPFSKQIYQELFCVLGIIWGVLTIIFYIFIREVIFCVTCIDIINNQSAYNQIRELLNRSKHNEFVLEGSEITLEIERYIENGLLQIRRNQSLSEIKEDDKVRLYFEQPFVKIVQDRKQILEKGLFIENYF